MRVIKDGDRVVGVALSRRNLRTLLAKLDGNPVDSTCRIAAPMLEPFYVQAEEDVPHYMHADRPEEIRGQYGVMHPDTERALA